MKLGRPLYLIEEHVIGPSFPPSSPSNSRSTASSFSKPPPPRPRFLKGSRTQSFHSSVIKLGKDTHQVVLYEIHPQLQPFPVANTLVDASEASASSTSRCAAASYPIITKIGTQLPSHSMNNIQVDFCDFSQRCPSAPSLHLNDAS